MLVCVQVCVGQSLGRRTSVCEEEEDGGMTCGLVREQDRCTSFTVRAVSTVIHVIAQVSSERRVWAENGRREAEKNPPVSFPQSDVQRASNSTK